MQLHLDIKGMLLQRTISIVLLSKMHAHNSCSQENKDLTF